MDKVQNKHYQALLCIVIALLRLFVLIISLIISLTKCELSSQNFQNSIKIEYNSNKKLSDYIYDNINNPHMKNFMDMEYDFDEEVKPVYNLNHIDIKKAYATFDKCDYYKGFLGKITDFRECNKIMGIGIYTITNIECDIEIINELEYLFDGNAYPSPELEYFNYYKNLDT